MKHPFETKDTLECKIEDVDTTGNRVILYASAFESVDSHRDTVAPGSFAKTIAENKGEFVHLMYHDPKMPVGKSTSAVEDDYGLKMESNISDTLMGRDCLTLMRDGVITNNSIGYYAIKHTPNAHGGRRLQELALKEFSSLVWGSNPNAINISVKEQAAQLLERKQVLDNAIRRGNLTDETYQYLETKSEEIKTAILDLYDSPLTVTTEPELKATTSIIVPEPEITAAQVVASQWAEFMLAYKKVASYEVQDNTTPAEFALEIKAENEALKTAVDTLTVEVKNLKLSAAAAAEAPVDALTAAFEAKAEELKNFKPGSSIEIKAPSDMLTSAVGDSLTLHAQGSYVAKPYRRNHIRQYLNIGKLNKPYLNFDREEAPEGDFALVGEGELKPQISFSSTPHMVQAVKIAGHYKMTTEVLQDTPELVRNSRTRAIEMLLNKEDREFLYGTAGIEGIFTKATPFNPGTVRVPNAQNIDVLRVAITQVTLSEYDAEVIMVHPNDLLAMDLTKDADGRYILPAMANGTGSTGSIGGVPIIANSQVNVGEWAVANLSLGVDTFQVAEPVIKVSESNADDFIHNKITIVMEERMLQAVRRPAAIVKGTFASAKAALTASAA